MYTPHQIMVLETTTVRFIEIVNKKLQEGWEVVPGTVAIAGAEHRFQYICFMVKSLGKVLEGGSK